MLQNTERWAKTHQCDSKWTRPSNCGVVLKSFPTWTSSCDSCFLSCLYIIWCEWQDSTSLFRIAFISWTSIVIEVKSSYPIFSFIIPPSLFHLKWSLYCCWFQGTLSISHFNSFWLPEPTQSLEFSFKHHLVDRMKSDYLLDDKSFEFTN